MSAVTVNFEASDLAAQIEKLKPEQIDRLPFGVVQLDREGVVVVYNATEARLSGYGMSPLGQKFFEVSRCSGKADFEARIAKAQEEGAVDLEFAFPGDPAIRCAKCASACSPVRKPASGCWSSATKFLFIAPAAGARAASAYFWRRLQA